MGSETEKNQQNNPGNQVDPNKKTPYQSGEDVRNPQDPTTKKPGQDSGTTDREGSEDVEKRRAS
jgi:hypothetical protein